MSPALVLLLDQYREALGYAVKVSSGYRCERHNVTVGGAKSSRHKLGLAADIIIPSCNSKDREKSEALLRAFFDRPDWECIIADRYAHVAVPRSFPSGWCGGKVQVFSWEEKGR